MTLAGHIHLENLCLSYHGRHRLRCKSTSYLRERSAHSKKWCLTGETLEFTTYAWSRELFDIGSRNVHVRNKKNNTWYTWHISAFLTNHSLRILKISFLAALVSTPPHQESAGSEFGASTGAPEDQGRRFGKALRHHLHLGPWDGHGMPWDGRCHKKPLDGSGVLLISVVSS